jgi:hypothetical protein
MWTHDVKEKCSEVVERFGAGDGTRTRDVQLGKLAFYH